MGIDSCCPKCGGDVEGDGYVNVMHCEYADEKDLEVLSLMQIW